MANKKDVLFGVLLQDENETVSTKYWDRAKIIVNMLQNLYFIFSVLAISYLF